MTAFSPGMSQLELNLKSTLITISVLAMVWIGLIGTVDAAHAKYGDRAPDIDKAGEGTMIGEMSPRTKSTEA